MLRVNYIDYYGSVSDGPGIRIMLFLQGCLRKCEGCHNKSTWDLNGGYLIDEEELVKIMLQKSPMRRITISGGEPLLQVIGLSKLVKLLDENNYDIALYTGNEFKDVPNEILVHLNYLKTGNFQNKFITTVEYYGSSNQQFIKLKE